MILPESLPCHNWVGIVSTPSRSPYPLSPLIIIILVTECRSSTKCERVFDNELLRVNLTQTWYNLIGHVPIYTGELAE